MRLLGRCLTRNERIDCGSEFFHHDVQKIVRIASTWDGKNSLLDHVANKLPGEVMHLSEIMEQAPVTTTGPELLALLRKCHAKIEVQRAIKTGNIPAISKALDLYNWAEESASSGWLARIDPASIQAGRFLDEEPQPLDWVFRGSLLAGTVGFLVAAPGAGKSFFLVNLALSITAGQCLTGSMNPGEIGSVLAIFAEESIEILHQRIRDIAFSLNVSRSACDRFYSIAATGQDIRLVQAGSTGNPEATSVFRDIFSLCRRIPNLRLVILDPLSRLYGLPENDNSGPTVFVSMLEELAQETGSAVIVSHHTRKAGGRGCGYKDALEQDVLRGGSAFIGAIRWQMNLVTLKPQEAQKVIGSRTSRKGEFLAARVCKKNYGKPEEEFFLRRGKGGVLRPCLPSPLTGENNLLETVKSKIIETIKELEAEGKKITKKQLGDIYTKKWKSSGLKVSRDVIRSTVDLMLQNGEILSERARSPNGKNWGNYLGVCS
jgi:RecA-family ATPase